MRRLGWSAFLLLAAFAGADGVAYLFELEGPLDGVIHVPGLQWAFGDQALAFLVAEAEDAAIPFSGGLERTPLYDAGRLLIALPPPGGETASGARLETGLGTYPVEVGRDGVWPIRVASREEAERILAGFGLSAVYGGKARLMYDRQPQPEAAWCGGPCRGTRYAAYGGFGFRPAEVYGPGAYAVRPQGWTASACGWDAQYLGVDVESVTLHVRGRVWGSVTVEFLLLTPGGCRPLGSRTLPLLEGTYVLDHLVDGEGRRVPLPQASKAGELAVRVLLNVSGGADVVQVGFAVEYGRAYLHPLDVAEFADLVARPVALEPRGAPVQAVVLGPYMLPNGAMEGAVGAVELELEAVDCRPLLYVVYVEEWPWLSGVLQPTPRLGGCLYRLEASGRLPLAKLRRAFAVDNNVTYVVRLRHDDGSPPRVLRLEVGPHQPARGWRWVEVRNSTGRPWTAPWALMSTARIVVPRAGGAEMYDVKTCYSTDHPLVIVAESWSPTGSPIRGISSFDAYVRFQGLEPSHLQQLKVSGGYGRAAECVWLWGYVRDWYESVKRYIYPLLEAAKHLVDSAMALPPVFAYLATLSTTEFSWTFRHVGNGVWRLSWRGGWGYCVVGSGTVALDEPVETLRPPSQLVLEAVRINGEEFRLDLRGHILPSWSYILREYMPYADWWRQVEWGYSCPWLRG